MYNLAFLDYRTSRGVKYWSIVESRRVNGKPKNFILEYLGTAETLLQRINSNNEVTVKSYSHGDTDALVKVAEELDVISAINKHLPVSSKQSRNKCSVGTTLLLAAIGRACQPTSKMSWYNWCKNTSLEYCLKRSFKDLDSNHFWEQMNAVPISAIREIEKELTKIVISQYNIKLDTLLFDTTNFFTFIASDNDRCDLPQRGKNKQKRNDLRQVGMGLLVSRKEQLPLFHRTYKGNTADSNFFKNNLTELLDGIKEITPDINEVTIVFDKGNNSKENFKIIDNSNGLYYVGGLVPSHFKSMIVEANKNFSQMKIQDEVVPVYRIKKDIWGNDRTCVITLSNQLKEGQIRGIEQHLEKKYIKLQELKQQLESKKKRKRFSKEELDEKLKKIIKGQFIEDILKYEFIELGNNDYSFTYYIDSEAFEFLKENVLGRKIVVTNRHEWSNEEILLAYRSQSKVEYSFRNLKNPYHMAVRPQYHWTDQKIEVHFFICVLGYLLSVAAYTKARKQANYKKNIDSFLDDLKEVRLSCVTTKKGTKVKYQLEKIPAHLKKTLSVLNISNETLRSTLKISGYN